MDLVIRRARRDATELDVEACARPEADVVVEVHTRGAVTRSQVAFKENVAAARAAAGAGKVAEDNGDACGRADFADTKRAVLNDVIIKRNAATAAYDDHSGGRIRYIAKHIVRADTQCERCFVRQSTVESKQAIATGDQ